MDTVTIQFQRDFYHLLLNLQAEALSLRENLGLALKLIRDISDAEKAYLEVRDSHGKHVYQAISISDNEIINIHEAVSSGIIREAVRSRKAINVPSALVDPRFQSRESVQRLAIETVLCVPVFGAKTHGVLYLEGDRGFRESAEKIQLDAELFSKFVSPLLDRLLIEQERVEVREDTMDSLRKHYQLDGLLGESDVLYETVKAAMMVAPLDVSTLILGESGTGKTQLASLMHQNSNRGKGAFVEINCAALPLTLIENELFGAVAGGHSSATQEVTGKIAAANGGTLFLDEVGELPLEAQAKLLQFIQSGKYYPLGSSEVRLSDARLIFATNRDFKQLIAAGEFREDLFFRINSFEIKMPSLYERMSDIPIIANSTLEERVSKHKFPQMEFSAEANRALGRGTISGNIRGLQSFVERACINARLDNTDVIEIRHFPPEEPSASVSHHTDFQSATLAFQEELLRNKLEEADWNISKAARELNLSRSHVHNLINSFNLRRI